MKKNIIKSIVLFLAVTSLTSCLKDDSLVLDPAKGVNVIEFANPGQINVIGSIYPLYVQSYAVVPEVNRTITVSYSGPQSEAPEDITVNIAVAPNSVITEYNTNQNEAYELMPTSNYTMTTTSVVIKKGTSKASFNILFKPTSFDLGKALVLPLRITSVSSGTISGNFNTILLNVGAKNRIDGLYSYKTSATTSLVPNADDKDVPLVTSGANTVKTNLLNTYANIMVYSIDPVTNKVTVVSGLGTPVTDPVSNYNPTTKVMFVKWTSGTRSFEETFTYTGVR
ncbi:DUF1735 domain-containing protein [Pedobacter lithocola]|uniref:DUF1735 domain-containing protein n=1 Tax=Pedobacter lithocola TaxID=1908239 RepID=A0ABV8PCQ0_9SPHI